jgi:hypothetical protein
MKPEDKAVVQQALEALNKTCTECGSKQFEIEAEAITALRQLLEQPEPVQEPVVWHHPDCEGECIACLIERDVQAAYGAQGLAYLHRRVTTTPAQPEPVQEPWSPNDTANRIGGLPQDFVRHAVENEGDWSEWVNPNSEQYFMKCCDCGLVHEMQFKVAKYSEGDECEFVSDAELQAVFRARRATPPAQPAAWVGLTKWEIIEMKAVIKGTLDVQFIDFARAIEAKLREKNGGAA